MQSTYDLLDIARRLEAKSRLGGTSELGDECILWDGYVRPDGYGDMSAGGKLHRVHRMAFEVAFGPVPAHRDVDHMCHNLSDCVGGLDCPHRLCVNPHHLCAVPRIVNARAGRTGSTLRGVVGAICDEGHAMTVENSIRAFGRAWCLTCKVERKQRLRAS